MTQAQAAQILDFDDTTVPCIPCFISALELVVNDKPFLALTAATLRIGAASVMQVTKILPPTMTTLRLFVEYDVEIRRLIDKIFYGIPSLEELQIYVNRPRHSHPYTLSPFLSVPRTLKIFHFEDSLPLHYSEVDLETFLHMHPHLTSLRLNPYPSVEVQPAELPSMACLDVLSRQSSHTLVEFGALLQLDECIPPRNDGLSPSGLQVLDLGQSQLMSDSTHHDPMRHLQKLFPKARICSSPAAGS